MFDTGHQSYVHKLLTGRQDFSGLRQRGGIAGYPQRSESVHDVVESSHASSSLSWADGISRAFEMTGQTNRHVVAVVGDGALTGGMTWEALNNISDDNTRNLVIDRQRQRALLRSDHRRHRPLPRRCQDQARLPRRCTTRAAGSSTSSGRRDAPSTAASAAAVHGFLTRFIKNEGPYSNLEIKYIGPIDGHDIEAVERALRQAKSYAAPVIVHTITEKGRGYEPARARRGRPVPRGGPDRPGNR